VFGEVRVKMVADAAGVARPEDVQDQCEWSPKEKRN